MRISFNGYLGKNHSWSYVCHNIARELIKNHQVEMQSTNGNDFFPADLTPCLKPLSGSYDLQLSYTLPTNFPHYLQRGGKNRFGIYNYDGTDFPLEWVKYVNYVDYLLPSSTYARDVFLKAKIPASKMVVVPHGVNLSDFQGVKPHSFATEKKVKIGVLLGQVHHRKNITGILESYGRAFTKKDDVVLILKGSQGKTNPVLDVDVMGEIKKFRKKFNNAGEVIWMTQYLDKIEEFILGCDIGYSISNIEMFHLPSLQFMAAGKVTIASGVGGNTDFMNEGNSILVGGKMGRADARYQYWVGERSRTNWGNLKAEMFVPDIEEAAEKLRGAVKDLTGYEEHFKVGMKETAEKFSWKNATDQILSLVK